MDRYHSNLKDSVDYLKIVYLMLLIAGYIVIFLVYHKINEEIIQKNRENERIKELLEKQSKLYGILRTVANVNQLLITEKSVANLVQKVCKTLTEYHNYSTICIG